MKKQLLKKSSVLVIACICWLGLVGCSGSTAQMDGSGGIKVADAGGACSVRVIEIEGAKYVIAVGFKKCAICPAVNQN